jgi:hypothetical protein
VRSTRLTAWRPACSHHSDTHSSASLVHCDPSREKMGRTQWVRRGIAPRARMTASCAALVLLLGGGAFVVLSLFAFEHGRTQQTTQQGAPPGATAPVFVAAFDDKLPIGFAQPLPSAIDSSRLSGRAPGGEPPGSGQPAIMLTTSESQRGNSVILGSVRSLSRSTDGAVMPRVWV